MRDPRPVKLPLALLLVGGLLGACQGSGPGVVVTVAPAEVALPPGADQTFTAQVTGAADTAVSWSVTGGTVEGVGGTVTYHAPVAPGSYEVKATSVADPTRQAAAAVTVVTPGGTLWLRPFGTDSTEAALAVAVDLDGNVIAVGYTEGALEGENAGESDAYVQKRAADGDVLWTRQFGTSANEGAYGVAADAAGNVLVAGTTDGALAGANAGGEDAFVRKYGPDGGVLWTRQFGTADADAARAVTLDAAGNVLVAGYTFGSLTDDAGGLVDAFVRKYDPNGDIVWTRQFGGVDRYYANGVAADAAGNVIVVGYTEPSNTDVSTANAFIRKYDQNGDFVSFIELDTGADEKGLGVAVEAAGSVLVVGITEGALASDNAGGLDAFVSKYTAGGDEVWTRQFGTNSDDYALAAAVDAAGNVLVAGYTFGNLAGDADGAVHAFVRKYGPDGMVAWTRQPAAGTFSAAAGVAVDSARNVLFSGFSDATLEDGGSASGSALVGKLAP
ncbi:MAG: SBBP repeat-containing protein [Trueperaceae bacterium]|nr:SBBP repeat-containing protein [Trueperaceae bacterium]MCW5819623.1 SBBP repeat-containing protein [Trueperaceae bacterium]